MWLGASIRDMNHTPYTKAGLRTALSLLIFTISLIVFLLINPGNRGQDKNIPTMQDNFGNLYPLKPLLKAKESGRIETSMLTVSDRPPIVLLRVFLSTNVMTESRIDYKAGTQRLPPGDILGWGYTNAPISTNRLLNFVVGFRDGTNEVEIATLQKAK